MREEERIGEEEESCERGGVMRETEQELERREDRIGAEWSEV